MTYLIGTLLVIFFVYAFQGLLAFVPWLMGYVYSIVYFPVEIINQVVYPVGRAVYLVYIGLVMFVLIRWILNIYHTHH